MGIKIEDTFNPISTGAGVLTSIIGALSARKQMKASIRAQQEENQKTRQYNLMLAQLQNQWNIDQWNRENAYNDPTAMMQRFANAGLNKNLIYSQGNLSAPSPELTSGSPGYSADTSAITQMPTIGDAVLRGMDTALKAAQIKNIDADTNKKNLESEGQKYQNVIYRADANVADQMAQGNLKLLNTTIDVEYEGGELRKEQKEFVKKQCQKIDKEIPILDKQLNSLAESIQSMKLDNALKEIDKMYRSDYWKQTLSNMKSDTNYKNASAKEIITLLDEKEKLFREQGNKAEKEAAWQEIQNEFANFLKQPPTFDLGNCKSWYEFKLALEGVQGYMNTFPKSGQEALVRGLLYLNQRIHGGSPANYTIPR